jgi:hypothetical protein
MARTSVILIIGIILIIVVIISIIGIVYLVNRRNKSENGNNNNGNNGGNNSGGNNGGGGNETQIPPPINTTSEHIRQTLLLLQNKYNVELWGKTQTGLLIQYLNSPNEGQGRYVVLTSPNTLSVGDFSRNNLPENAFENYFGSITMQIIDEDVTYYNDNHLSIATGTVSSNQMIISESTDDSLFIDDDTFKINQYNPPK